MRGLMIAGFCAIFALAMSLGSDGASAAGKKRVKQVGPICHKPVPQPNCGIVFFRVPVCVAQDACGRCQGWVCRTIIPPLFVIGL